MNSLITLGQGATTGQLNVSPDIGLVTTVPVKQAAPSSGMSSGPIEPILLVGMIAGGLLATVPLVVSFLQKKRRSEREASRVDSDAGIARGCSSSASQGTSEEEK
jgi:hypothetical protein